MPSRNEMGTPVPEGMIARLVQGVKYVVSGVEPASWFGPNQPNLPIAQDDDTGAHGRVFDYQTGLNQTITPRPYEPITFTQLRSLADGHYLVRLAIETRKDELFRMDWGIFYKDTDKEQDEETKKIEDFLQYPDQQNDFETWGRKLMEDMLVIDAPCIYPVYTKGGQLYSLDVMDGGMIALKIDYHGKRPVPPSPAYQSIIKGVQAVNYTADELVYYPRNLRSWRLYGLSPVEQIVLIINIAIRRDISKLQYYTEGTVPDMIIQAPETWSVEQIKYTQEALDTALQGNTSQRRKMKMIPAVNNILQTKEMILKDAYDEWLARIISFAFSISPNALLAQVNRATAETNQSEAESSGLEPHKRWFEKLMNYIIAKHMKRPDMMFRFKTKAEVDILRRSQADDIDIKNGSRSINEVREGRGEDTIEGADSPMIYTPSGIIPLESAVQGLAMPSIQMDPYGNLAPTNVNVDDSSAPKTPVGNENDKKDDAEKIEKVKKKIRVKQLRIKNYNERVSKYKGRILGLFNKQKKQIVDAINRALDNVAKIDIVEAQRVQQAIKDIDLYGYSTLADITEDELKYLGSQTGIAVLGSLGIADEGIIGIVNQRALAWAKNRSAELVTRIDETTKKRLNDLIQRAMRDDLDRGELTRAILDSENFSEYRADMIARTEMKIAENHSNVEAWRESGVVSGKQWLMSNDHAESDECDLNAEEGVISIDDVFPSGDDAPPNHPNCNCTMVAVVDEAMQAQLEARILAED